ncbi:adipogenesis regulatory factor [Anolis carolinensis]|uniref:adipogenesis regulatory factor n=1 Tax=Anolis carolinensis TaxID=28377 RepID=UPI0002039F6A|nr:PREDICTED: adipogenesis regulatory factor [Anolis carolinensis]|eukprot:XP_003223318.1 PREDICTED: adipogenesis regulatory factor [Anolis carolinensis]
MSGKNIQGFAQQTERTMHDAANSLGKATQKGMNQVSEAGQKAVDQTCKMVQEGVDKATGEAANAISGLEKKIGLKK